VRFRHRQKLIDGVFTIIKDKVTLSYKPTLSITPGQFAVIYQNDVCLGGGIVNSIVAKATN
jgi:tRNA-specific 2-thiouridylase